MSLIRTGVGPRFMVSRPPSHLTWKNLMGFSQRKQLLSVYKHLFKLRHFLSDTNLQHTSYCNLLRRKIKYSDLQLRRQKILGLADPISPDMLARRLANTYAFIFNASCAAHIPTKSVFFYEDVKQQSQERPETNVIQTLLHMEMECPSEIKYDHKLQWVEKTREFYEKVARSGVSSREINDLYAQRRAHFLGFLQYEHTLMCANETSEMCL